MLRKQECSAPVEINRNKRCLWRKMQVLNEITGTICQLRQSTNKGFSFETSRENYC